MQIQPLQPQPPITLTRPDVERLTELLDHERGGNRDFLVERLEEEVSRAVIVERAPDVVTLGSRVEYENLESGERREVVLVLPEDADAATGRLSVLTPIGCSLIGVRQGETFTWDAGAHRWRLRVPSVRAA
ncbi:MAG: GreA/GreB family elongation factor [Archangium sp.]|nr:GreA/GreB family elongation factor [Archangium sp.]